MRPTFLGFETAKRGVMVSQKALDIVGHNIMNSRTPGYTRQRVDIYAIAPSNHNARFGVNRVGLAGQGVDAGGVSQIRDKFLDKRFREEYGDVGYYDKASGILEDIESALSEYDLNPDDANPMGTGLQNALKGITNALAEMANEKGDSTTYATIVSTQFQNMTQLLQQMDAKLKNVAEQTKYDMKLGVDNVNGMLEKIAKLNYNISQDMAVTKASNGEYYGPNELMDQRNLLIDELSSYGEVLVEYQSDGTVKVDMNGHNVVDKFKADAFVMEKNANGTVALSWQSSGKPVDLRTGELKASMDMINGRGVNAHLTNEVTKQGIRYFQDKLNAYAITFANVVNNAIPKIQPDTPPGEEAVPIPGQYRTLIESIDGKPLTAGNITISKDWANNSSLIIYQEGSKNTDALNEMMINLKSGKFTFRGIGEIGDGLFAGTFDDFVDDYQSTLGTQISFHSERLSATATIAGDLADRRDEVSGVNQDEETVNMITFNKALQAASRVMTTMDEALDVIINKMGLVGR